MVKKNQKLKIMLSKRTLGREIYILFLQLKIKNISLSLSLVQSRPTLARFSRRRLLMKTYKAKIDTVDSK